MTKRPIPYILRLVVAVFPAACVLTWCIINTAKVPERRTHRSMFGTKQSSMPDVFETITGETAGNWLEKHFREYLPQDSGSAETPAALQTADKQP